MAQMSDLYGGFNFAPASFQIDPMALSPSGPIATAAAAQATDFVTANPTAGTGGPVAGNPDFFSLASFLGGKNADGTSSNGWGGLALGALSGLGNLYMGMQQYGLAKDQLNFSKQAFNKNYAAQRQSINTQLEDRQRARVASNPGAYQSVGDYMNQNRVA